MASSFTTILLVRHGNTATTGTVLPGRAPGLHLSETGKSQAEAVAKRISELGHKPAAIYVSPLERARETAAPIAKALKIRPIIERGLLECDFGTWTGKKLAVLRVKKEWRAVQNAPSTFRFPEGESFTEIVVSHADPIKAAVTYAQGVPLDLFQRTVISTCSVSAITFSETTPIVLTVNNTGSLKDLAPS